MDTLCKNNDNHRGLARRDKDSSGKGPYTLLCWPFPPQDGGKHPLHSAAVLKMRAARSERRGFWKVWMMRKGLISTCKVRCDGIAPGSLPCPENSINNNAAISLFGGKSRVFPFTV